MRCKQKEKWVDCSQRVKDNPQLQALLQQEIFSVLLLPFKLKKKTSVIYIEKWLITIC